VEPRHNPSSPFGTPKHFSGKVLGRRPVVGGMARILQLLLCVLLCSSWAGIFSLQTVDSAVESTNVKKKSLKNP